MVLAQIEVKILSLQKLFFVPFTERPTEVPVMDYKKSFCKERLKQKAGISS